MLKKAVAAGIIFLSVFCLNLSAMGKPGWVGRNHAYASLNPNFIQNRFTFAYRFSFSEDENHYLYDYADPSFGATFSLTPYSITGGLCLNFSPFDVFDFGVQFGASGTWDFYEFADGTPVTGYGSSARDNMDPENKILGFFKAFIGLRWNQDDLTLSTILSWERWSSKSLWYYREQDVMLRNNWLFVWDTHATYRISSRFCVLFRSHFLRASDTGEWKFSAGPGFGMQVSGSSTLALFYSRHFKRVNRDGGEVAASFISRFNWR